ncbi:FeoA family protein [Thermosyntropha sp.]|uniref:FeoA family protein n=1 Tax=Thermosyntropha sp. TaxID=2740820 RepID=UPI0025D11747|nr:FeoA family protein [Thermosyntropha sp.]MBO8159265.1 ferrous iron transport protein A [Thermosyntropha sp.]
MSRTLKDLLPGEKAKVIKVLGNGAIRRRMMDMGIVPGVELEMERYAPLGDPVEIKIKGYHLSLRKEEAESVVLE